MNLDKITIRNFLSFGDEEKTIDLDNRGLVLIEGLNGAGKSTIAEAMLWCLYGMTMRGYQGDEVINRTVGENCFVSVSIDGAACQITRARKFDGHKVSLRVWKGADEVTSNSVASTQEIVDKMLGMNGDTFRNTVIFGQGAQYRFSTLSDSEQKEVFDDALNIGIYTDALTEARSEIADIATELKINETETSNAANEFTSKLGDWNTFKKKHNAFDKERNMDVARLQSETAVLRKRQERYAEQWKLFDVKSKEGLALREAAEAEEEKTKKLAAEVAGLDGAFRVKLKLLNEIRRELQQTKTKKGITKCSECGQKVDTDHLASVVKRMAERVKSDEEELETHENAITEAAVRRDTQQKIATKARVKYVEFDQNEVSPLRAAGKLAEEQEYQIDKNTKAIEKLRKDASPFEGLARKAKKESDLAVMMLRKLELSRQPLEERLKLLQFWLEAFGTKGLRSLIIDNVLPMLNEKANEYAEVLSDGSIAIEFRTQSFQKSGKAVEKFEVAVMNTAGAEDYRGLSAGEKAKVDLCVGLALQHLVSSRASAPINVAFYDEPFESLDDSALDRVVTLLTSKLKTKGQSIFVITHNEELKSYFPEVVTVTKDSTGTTL